MITKTIFAGSGGQGVLMMGYLLAVSAMKAGMQVTYLPSYGAEVRGGTANCTVAISEEEIASPVASSPDYTVVLNQPSMMKFQDQMKKGGVMLINSSLVNGDPTRKDIEAVKLPASKLAADLGNERTLNMIVVGAFVAKTKIISAESLTEGLKEVFKGKKQGIIDLNQKGLNVGADYILKNENKI